jgi:hypothetical protein
VFLLLFFAWKNCIEAVFTLSSQLAVVNFATLGAYCLEVLLFCLSEYKNERQQIITDRRSVWQIYLHEHCLKDFIAIVLIVLQSVEVAERLDTYALFLLLRIGSTYLTFDRMLELVSKLENRLAVSTNAETMIAMIKLLFKIFMFLHFLSIFLNLMAELEVEFGQYDTWISQHSHSLNGDYDRYIVGWYWGATILSTVGFGDISPNSTSSPMQIISKDSSSPLSKCFAAWPSAILSMSSVPCSVFEPRETKSMRRKHELSIVT